MFLCCGFSSEGVWLHHRWATMVTTRTKTTKLDAYIRIILWRWTSHFHCTSFSTQPGHTKCFMEVNIHPFNTFLKGSHSHNSRAASGCLTLRHLYTRPRIKAPVPTPPAEPQDPNITSINSRITDGVTGDNARGLFIIRRGVMEEQQRVTAGGRLS